MNGFVTGRPPIAKFPKKPEKIEGHGLWGRWSCSGSLMNPLHRRGKWWGECDGRGLAPFRNHPQGSQVVCGGETPLGEEVAGSCPHQPVTPYPGLKITAPAISGVRSMNRKVAAYSSACSCGSTGGRGEGMYWHRYPPPQSRLFPSKDR